MLTGLILFFVGYFVFNYILNRIFFKKAVDLERRFIQGAIHFEVLKHHMLQMLELVYERAAEEDPKYLEEYKVVKLKLEEKFNEICNQWIKDTENALGYKLSYSSWDELINVAEKIAQLLKKKRNESRERD